MAHEVNVGLVGYKFMGKAHSHAYRNVSRFFDTETVPVMKAICGRNESALAAAADRYGWESYETSWERLVQRDDIDLIDISTPNVTHRDIAEAASTEGKHVLCEKPLAMNVSQAEEMAAAVQWAGVKHMVCFNFRFVPAIALAKRFIDQGYLGDVYHFRAVWLQNWLVDCNAPLRWRLRRDLAGSGVHGDLNSHFIDLARYLVGEIDQVVGMTETFVKERPVAPGDLEVSGGKGGVGQVDVDDAALFLARFENGALGSFEASRVAAGQRNYQRIEVNGSEGSLIYNLEDFNYLWFHSCSEHADAQGFRKIMVTDPCHPYTAGWWPPGHPLGYEHTFVHAIYELLRSFDERTMPSPNFTDGLECQRVLDAVDRSIARARWVPVQEPEN